MNNELMNPPLSKWDKIKIGILIVGVIGVIYWGYKDQQKATADKVWRAAHCYVTKERIEPVSSIIIGRLAMIDCASYSCNEFQTIDTFDCDDGTTKNVVIKTEYKS